MHNTGISVLTGSLKCYLVLFLFGFTSIFLSFVTFSIPSGANTSSTGVRAHTEAVAARSRIVPESGGFLRVMV